MIVEILRSECEHLKDISHYNYNFYKLPFKVNGYDVLLEKFDSGEHFDNNYLGEYNAVFGFGIRLHTNTEHSEDTFIFNSEDLHKDNHRS